MIVKFQRETFDQVYAEALPLLVKHKDEIAHFPDIPLDVDVARYRRMDGAGLLRIYTARLHGDFSNLTALIGYAVFIVDRNPHYQSSLQAVQDVLFVDPEHRNSLVGVELIRFTERELRWEGIEAIYQHVKLAHPALGAILGRIGYAPIETIFVKRLKPVNQLTS